jgi:hypothetical protein
LFFVLIHFDDVIDDDAERVAHIWDYINNGAEGIICVDIVWQCHAVCEVGAGGRCFSLWVLRDFGPFVVACGGAKLLRVADVVGGSLRHDGCFNVKGGEGLRIC